MLATDESLRDCDLSLWIATEFHNDAYTHSQNTVSDKVHSGRVHFIMFRTYCDLRILLLTHFSLILPLVALIAFLFFFTCTMHFLTY